ncbi:histidine kinase [Desulfolucanica intricata]|uniref:histidine kinase n=1 Tax=Desulfolucanica intricata TaxID=1285191 RepID=UPI000836FA8B|nr:histidine kinase [Desulfolucanica intricata]
MSKYDEYIRSRVPWSLEPSLKQMTQDVGIDFDAFIERIKVNKSDAEIAAEFAVSEKVIGQLREHFMTHGIQSIVGQD